MYSRNCKGLRIVSTHKSVSGEGYLMIRGEDLTLSIENYESSAQNNFMERLLKYPDQNGIDVIVDIGVPVHVSVSKESVQSLGLAEGKTVWVHFKASATNVISK